MNNPSKPTLGRLQRVELRDAWLGEASHFTPWLALPENIALLSEAIGIELKVESVEKNVGPFRADILCRDTLSNHYCSTRISASERLWPTSLVSLWTW